MAYQAQIRIKTTGLQQLNKVNAAVDRINKSIIQINRGSSRVKTNDIVKVSKQNLALQKDILKVETEKTKQLLQQNKLRRTSAKGDRAGGGVSGGGVSGRGGGSGILSSAVISGAFPLLFGQGPLVGAAGALGGGLGAAFGGQMGGFAGGLAATSAVTAIQQFAVSAREVGDALKDPTRALDALSDAGVKVDDAVKQQVQTLLAAGKEFEALEVINNQLNESIGTLAAERLKDLDTSFDELDNAAGKLFLKLKSDLAPALIAIIDLAKKFVDSVGQQRIRKKARDLDQDAFREAEKVATEAARKANPNQLFGGIFFDATKGPAADKYYEVLNEESKKILQRELPNFLSSSESGSGLSISSPVEGVASDAATFNAGTQIDEILKKQTDLVKKVKEESALTLRISQLRADGLNPAIAKTVAGIEREAELSKENLQTEIEKLLQIQARDGILDETNQKTLTALEAQLDKMDDLTDSQIESVKVMLGLADAANKTRDAFDEINNSIATNISDGLTAAIQGTKTLGEAAKAILNDIGNTLIRLGVNTILGGIAPGVFGGLLGFSRGGRPPTGKPSIVGERGPELFVPRRSGTIIPNDKLGGGSTNINVNVDASGSAVEGDNSQSKELGRLISVAIQSELLKQRRPGGLLR